MSDVRDQLSTLLAAGWFFPVRQDQAEKMADAILEQFDVTLKSVVSDEELGQWVKTSAAVDPTPREAANRFRARLDDAGLTIVRIEEVE